LLAVMLFAISMVALSQLAVYYWRAMLVGAAAQPVSERILAAAGVRNGKLTGENFRPLLGLHDLTPELRSGGKNLARVRAYYALAERIASLPGRIMPAVAAWSERQLAVCARYAAVQIDRRLQANVELPASLRSG